MIEYQKFGKRPNKKKEKKLNKLKRNQIENSIESNNNTHTKVIKKFCHFLHDAFVEFEKINGKSKQNQNRQKN